MSVVYVQQADGIRVLGPSLPSQNIAWVATSRAPNSCHTLSRIGLLWPMILVTRRHLTTVLNSSAPPQPFKVGRQGSFHVFLATNSTPKNVRNHKWQRDQLRPLILQACPAYESLRRFHHHFTIVQGCAIRQLEPLRHPMP